MALIPKIPPSAPFALPFRTPDGTPLHFQEGFARALHRIDCTGRSGGADALLRTAWMEEPFASAQLEGTNTTRMIANRMIEGGRPPMTVDEQMVMNAHEAMAYVRVQRDAPLTVAGVLELHRLFNEETLEAPAGLRDAGQQKRLQALCDFANATDSGKGPFLHPIIRAIVAHFMAIHDHPFHDGNEALGRALFTWCALRGGYRLLDYVSISAVMVQAPEKYRAAFAKSKDGDVTAFIAYQLGVVEQALANLQEDMAQKTKSLSGFAESVGALEHDINRRQLALVQAALKTPALVAGIGEHAALHRVTYLTARADLEKLEKMKLLRRSKTGAKLVFRVPADLKTRIARLKKQAR